MKKNIIKFFTVLFVFIISSIQSFAVNNEMNSLSKIIIEPLENNNYKLDLYFSDTFKSNAFIQQRESGSYYVFLPDTKHSKDVKVIYKDKNDKSNIKVTIEDKLFVKEASNSNYLRLSIDMIDDYSIKLISKVNDKKAATSIFNFYSFMILLCIAGAIFLIRKITDIVNTNQSNYYTSTPNGFNIPAKNSINTKIKTNKSNKVSIPQNNINNNIKTSSNDNFSCFDIPIPEGIKDSNEFKDTLKQTSAILKEKTIKSKLTNPITRSTDEDASELKLPGIEEVKSTNKPENEDKKAELLSVLNISPSKGFYLTTVDDTFALFGFVKDEVFLLTKFDDLTQINLQARFYDKNEENEVYIVRLDSYKAMVEISDTGIRELTVL